MPDCRVWVHGSNNSSVAAECWTLTQAIGMAPSADRTVGGSSLDQLFTADNLKVEILGVNTWVPGAVDTGNLMGTVRSLDGITGGVDLNCSATGSRLPALDCTLAPISRLV